MKDGAHSAHPLDPVEDEDPIVGNIEIDAVPMAASASNGVWTPVGLHTSRIRRALAADSMKGLVDLQGFEPWTSSMPWKRSIS